MFRMRISPENFSDHVALIAALAVHACAPVVIKLALLDAFPCDHQLSSTRSRDRCEHTFRQAT